MKSKTAQKSKQNLKAANSTSTSGRGFFITGTDTGVGKTVATFVLGVLLQEKGFDVGVMKPVQCAGMDAAFLRKTLNLDDTPEEINPFFAAEPLSPHLAFKRGEVNFNVKRVQKLYETLSHRHDIVLAEGAGGLLVPLKNDYLVADLARDMGLELIIVSRLGLGTINHTLMTIACARDRGLKIKGIVFNAGKNSKPGIPEQTNPDIIKKLSGVPVLGIIPSLGNLDRKEVLRKCTRKIDWICFWEEQRMERVSPAAFLINNYPNGINSMFGIPLPR